MPLHPPRLANRLLRTVLSAEDAEVVAGDLEEAMRRSIEPRAGAAAARRWYWRQVASIVFAYACNRSPQPEVSTPKGSIMSAFRQDIGYAVRSLRKQPAFTALAVAMLAIGIGATVAILSLTFAVLYKPLPFADPIAADAGPPARAGSRRPRTAAADDLVVSEISRVPRSPAGVRLDRGVLRVELESDRRRRAGTGHRRARRRQPTLRCSVSLRSLAGRFRPRRRARPGSPRWW